jgi:hypothetical protein
LIPSLLLEPGFEEKAVWQFFCAHIDEGSQTISWSLSDEDDERFLGHHVSVTTLCDQATCGMTSPGKVGLRA